MKTNHNYYIKKEIIIVVLIIINNNLIDIISNPIYKKIMQQLEEIQSDSKPHESDLKLLEQKKRYSNEIEIAYI